jgi:hypothetical protein
MVLADLSPIAADHVVEGETFACRGTGRGALLCPLALGPLYGLRFPAFRSLRRAVKATTSPLEVEVVERRALGLVD